MAVIDIKKTTFSVLDGTETPKSVSLKVGQGTLTYNRTQARDYIMDRGQLDTVRNGDEAPMDVRFSFLWEFIVGDGTTVSIEDAITGSAQALAQSWVSSASDPCEPWAVDIKVVYDPNCNNTKIETYLFPDYRWESLEHDFKAGTISSNGKCNAVAPTITRGT